MSHEEEQNKFFFVFQHRAAERLEMEIVLKDFGECHENSLIESFKISPHLICFS